MIWYRHWLELRMFAGMLTAWAVVAGPLYFRSELFDDRSATRPEMMMGPVHGLESSLDALELTAIARHVEFTWIIILVATWLVAGDGLRVGDRSQPGVFAPGAAQFTLSLPVSRRYVVTTRLAAAVLIAAVGLLISMTANALTLVALGRSIPVVQMLLASGIAILVILFWMCVLNAMLTLAGSVWGLTVTLFGMLVTTPIPVWSMSSAAAGTLPSPLLIAFALALAAAIYFATAICSEGDW